MIGEEAGAPVRVLVVEDDPRVRRAAARALERAGHEVRQAATAVDALEQLDWRPRVLVVDLVMPSMSGLKLVERVREVLPQVAVVLISGYPREGLVRDHGLAPDAEVLAKPFSPETLLWAVRSAL